MTSINPGRKLYALCKLCSAPVVSRTCSASWVLNKQAWVMDDLPETGLAFCEECQTEVEFVLRPDGPVQREDGAVRQRVASVKRDDDPMARTRAKLE